MSADLLRRAAAKLREHGTTFEVAVAEWLELEARMVGLRTTGAKGNSPEGHTFHALRVASSVLREDGESA
jgi:hypothetical protein